VFKQVVPEQTERNVIAAIDEARTSRQRFASTYNAFFDLAAPWKMRVNEGSHDEPRSPTDQDDVFDSTLQEVADDWAANIADEATPSYRDWASHEPVDSLSQSAKKQIAPFVKARKKLVYDTIRESSFEQSSQECYLDLGIGPCGMMIRYTRVGQPIDCEYAPLAQLLLGPGPMGGVGVRFWERKVKVRNLDTIWPDIDWSHIKPTLELRRQDKGSVTILEGGIRDYDAPEEAWDWYVIERNKVCYHKRFTGRGSCPLQVGRIFVSEPSAYGVNPGAKALAPARTLNEMAYLELKRTAKVVDPPGIFSDPTGTLNPEAGFEPGIWHEAGDGFNVQDLAPQNDVREAYFKREELKMEIRRALYQDKPYQRGQTPPSASQWIGEERMTAQRRTLYRARLHNEWTLSIIHRFEWILEKRGQLDPIEYEGEIVDVRPVTPLSRAADLAEVEAGEKLLAIVGSYFPNELGLEVNVRKTVDEFKKRMGDETVILNSDEERGAIMEQRAMQAGGAGEP